MAIAGVQQAAINSVGANHEHAGGVSSGCQKLAAVTPIKDTRKGEGQGTGSQPRNNENLTIMNTRFEFSIHEGTKEVMVKVINELTNETVREIPPEQVLDMVAKMWEVAGILVDERA